MEQRLTCFPAKKGTTDPTTLSHDETLEEAICFGWIDGQLGRRDYAAPAGQATMEVPADFSNALIGNPRAEATFELLTGADRYSLLYRIGSAKKAEVRARRIEQFVDVLARGETIHPRAQRPT